MVTIKTNRKSYMGSPTTQLDLTLSDLKGQSHSILRAYTSERSRFRPKAYVTVKR